MAVFTCSAKIKLPSSNDTFSVTIARSVDGKECVSRSSGSYLVWSALKKLGDREDGEATFDCPFKAVEQGFVPCGL